eukprot:TRINITY_DN8865_c0_g1_i2.p2 TRINITY_DN8865_c0_g1~~TRINITY_DN8865_c0_g1_i2.p2  ORF type:complete len:142 (+),score=39.93 TRINITY_DN8865_c0_g1_i2:195-620(+)
MRSSIVLLGVVLALAALAPAQAGCQRAKDLDMCAHLNGKMISTHTKLREFNGHTKELVHIFTEDGTKKDDPACQEAMTTYVCELVAGSGEHANVKSHEQCYHEDAVPSPSEQECLDVVELCGTTTVNAELCKVWLGGKDDL